MSAALRLVAEQALDRELALDDEAELDQLARSGGYLCEMLLRLPIPPEYEPFPDTWRERMATLAADLTNARPRTALQMKLAAEVWQDAVRAGMRPQ